MQSANTCRSICRLIVWFIIFFHYFLLLIWPEGIAREDKMKQKPARKNSHKEKIFTLQQNKRDFDCQKAHDDGIENRIHECCTKHDAVYKTELRKKGSHVA